MSRSRKHVPIGGIAVCRSEKQWKRIWNRQFRRISKMLTQTDPDLAPKRLRETSEVWDGGKDGKAWHGDCYCYWYVPRFGDECSVCARPWDVWGK